MTQRRGWCPSLYDPMPSGDGLLVRIKPPGMALSADAAMALAEAASRHGNGIIELTSRANLQIRGLSPASVAAFAEAMVACGLASSDEDAERRRIVLVSPLAGDDPSVAPETAAIAAAIEHGLAADPLFAALPSKFGIVVDGGGVLPLAGVRADILVRAVDRDFALYVDGDECALVCEAADAAVNAIRLARAFLVVSVTVPNPPARMRDLVQEVGVNRLLSAMEIRRDPPKDVMAGLDPAIHVFSARPELVDARVKPGHDEFAGGAGRGIGFLQYQNARRGAFGLGVPFGAMYSATLSILADIARRFGDGKLRMMPWRALLLGGVPKQNAAELRVFAERAGLIVDPGDPRLRVTACAGRPACASASVDARADAAIVAKFLTGYSGTVHISGCGKGCAHPRRAEFTLVGENGRYGLVRNGSAGQPSEIAGLTVNDACDLIRQDIAA